ncbi:response regulator transcription factor [Streptomyces sp. NPDC056309]|uniref:response regulator transcription factor n=1 Tax=Streptomyces sp. NPDC056309 TaxID=3345781 RepID=UPI0035DB5DD1
MISTIDLRQQIAAAADELNLPLTFEQVVLLTNRIAERTDSGYQPRKALTGQMYAVLVGIALGESSTETGKRLSVTAHTVRTHKLRLYKALGARNAAHAVAIATQLGILRVAETGGRS